MSGKNHHSSHKMTLTKSGDLECKNCWTNTTHGLLELSKPCEVNIFPAPKKPRNVRSGKCTNKVGLFRIKCGGDNRNPESHSVLCPSFQLN